MLQIREEATRAPPRRVSSPRHNIRMGTTEPKKYEQCASCGSSGAHTLKIESAEVLLCDGCADRLRAGEAISFWPPTKEEPPPPPEDRFADLFKAARILLEMSISEE